MISKSKEKELAVRLRKQGKTYNEILAVVPVAKSTLSLWLRDVGLSSVQTQKLTKKKQAAQRRGAVRRREIRLEQTASINKVCQKDIDSISDRELFLIGVALYWAEGTKPTGNRPGAMVDFANSDPGMIHLFIVWLEKCCGVAKSEIKLRLHIHENHCSREQDVIKTWCQLVHVSHTCFTKTSFKKHNPKTNRYKTDASYIGLVSVRVKRSTDLNRRIMGWVRAIILTQK